MRIDWYIPDCCPDYPVTFARYEGEGMGGSESHVLMLLTALARRKHAVTIYGDHGPATERGVRFLTRANFDASAERDVLVWHRTPHPERPEMFAEASAGFKVAWNPDAWAGCGLEATKPLWERWLYAPADVVWNVSAWQRALILQLYATDATKHVVLPCATDISGFRNVDIAAKHAADSLSMIYCSVPSRGLDRVLGWWPRVSEILGLDRCELHVCGDATIHGMPSSIEEIARMAWGARAAYPNVTIHGAVPRHELAALQAAAHIWIYPTNFDEHFCLSAAECQAAGAVPVATAQAGLEQTVLDGETGVLVPIGGNFEGRYTEALFALCRDQDRRTALAVAGRRRAFDLFSPAKVAQAFERVIAGERLYNF